MFLGAFAVSVVAACGSSEPSEESDSLISEEVVDRIKDKPVGSFVVAQGSDSRSYILYHADSGVIENYIRSDGVEGTRTLSAIWVLPALGIDEDSFNVSYVSDGRRACKPEKIVDVPFENVA